MLEERHLARFGPPERLRDDGSALRVALGVPLGVTTAVGRRRLLLGLTRALPELGHGLADGTGEVGQLPPAEEQQQDDEDDDQLWRFITPGLTRTERRLALPFVVLSQVMFAVGMVFAYVVIPQGLRILLGMAGDRVDIFLTLDEYLSFFLTTSVAFGLVFELPLVLVFLSLVGVVTAAGLRRARPYAMVAIVVVAAIITPTTDAVTLALMAGPMALFYELSIGAAWLIERRRRRR